MDAAFHITPFAFDRIFTAAQPASRDTAAELAALNAELDLFKLRFDGDIAIARAEGFEAGLAQAREEIATALLAATDALHASIEAVESEFAAIEQRLSGVAADVAMAAAEGLAGHAIAADPTRAIDEAIGRVLTQVARGQELRVRVHPDLVERMETVIAERQSRDRRRLSLIVVPDAAQAVGDALITWDQGGLALDASARREAILAELGLDLPPSEPGA